MEYEARQGALARQETAEFREHYRNRAAVEGTISQAVQRTGLRRAGYRRLSKVHLEHCAEATAINLIRLVEYFVGTPRTRTRTRQSHLTRVLAEAA